MTRLPICLSALAFSLPAFAGDHMISKAIEEDLDDMLEVAVEAVSVPLTCTPTFGDCRLCYEAAGTLATGTFDVFTTADASGATATSCSGQVAYGTRSASYTVNDSALSGSWDGTPANGNYDVLVGGTRDARLSVTTPNLGTRGKNADSELSAEVTLVDSAMSDFSASLLYTGYGGHAWTVLVTGDTSTVTGEIQRDDGATCTVSGTIVDGEVKDIDVLCG